MHLFDRPNRLGQDLLQVNSLALPFSEAGAGFQMLIKHTFKMCFTAHHMTLWSMNIGLITFLLLLSFKELFVVIF